MNKTVLCLALSLTAAGCASTSEVDEVRRQLSERDQQSQQRFSQIESKISNERLLEMVSQVERLNGDVAKLKGDIEVLNYNLQTTQKRQNDLYNDLDQRLARYEGNSSPAVSAAPASAPSSSAAAPADPAAADPATADFDRALNLLRARDFAKAVPALKAFGDKYATAKQTPDAAYWLGVAYAANGQCKETITTHTAFAAKHPNHAKAPDALRNVGNCQRDLGDVPAARVTWGKLIKLYPSSDASAKAKQQLASLK